MTVGDMLADIKTPGLTAALPHTASVADAILSMRDSGFAALLVFRDDDASDGGDGPAFGIFTDRDYVHNVLPCCAVEGTSPRAVRLGDAARWNTREVGYSHRIMSGVALGDRSLVDTYHPETVVCVERRSRVIDCLRLMLGHGLQYVPVIGDADEPIDVISMRDINLFIAQPGVRGCVALAEGALHHTVA
jgi:CBS domain-containing protein